MTAKDFHEIVSGRRRGLLATLARGVLWLGQAPYLMALWLRKMRFKEVSDAVQRVAVPVISVGNLTVGGTGKTPMVKWIARRLREQGLRVAILSRGYGAEAGAKNDEALELEQALPDVPHLQNPSRVESAKVAIEELECEALLLDDGFQHRQLGRDLDIVLLDATEPFGHGHVLPRGLLREPIGELKRADVVCLTRADLVDEDRRKEVRLVVQRIAPDAIWCEVAHQPQRLVNAAGEHESLNLLLGRRVMAFCGIGNPAAFHKTLDTLGCEVIQWKEFPDHHNYRREDIQAITQDAQGADLILCTHKDLAKIQATHLDTTPLWAAEVEMHLMIGKDQLEQRLRETTWRTGR